MWADVIENQVIAFVVDMAHIGKRKNRLTAIAFHTSHRADSTSGRNGGLGSIANAVGFDSIGDQAPIQVWTLPITGVGGERCGSLPYQILRIINASVDCREWSVAFSQFNAGFHGEVAYIFHDLTTKLQ